jgi:hypothetical protein
MLALAELRDENGVIGVRRHDTRIVDDVWCGSRLEGGRRGDGLPRIHPRPRGDARDAVRRPRNSRAIRSASSTCGSGPLSLRAKSHVPSAPDPPWRARRSSLARSRCPLKPCLEAVRFRANWPLPASRERSIISAAHRSFIVSSDRNRYPTALARAYSSVLVIPAVGRLHDVAQGSSSGGLR